MNKAPKQQEISFSHEFKGEWLNEDHRTCYGRKEVTVFYEDRINEIWVEGIKVDFEMPWQRDNIYSVAERELIERELM